MQKNCQSAHSDFGEQMLLAYTGKLKIFTCTVRVVSHCQTTFFHLTNGKKWSGNVRLLCVVWYCMTTHTF